MWLRVVAVHLFIIMEKKYTIDANNKRNEICQQMTLSYPVCWAVKVVYCVWLWLLQTVSVLFKWETSYFPDSFMYYEEKLFFLIIIKLFMLIQYYVYSKKINVIAWSYLYWYAFSLCILCHNNMFICLWL